MARIIKLSIASLLLLIFATYGFSGNRYFIAGQGDVNYNITTHHISKFYAWSAINIQNGRLKNHRAWKHIKKKYKYKIRPIRFLYDPRYLNYIGKRFEKRENVTVNIINNGNGDIKEKSKKSNPKKYQPISPPHILNVNDTFSDKSKKHLKSTINQDGIILIRGTNVSETRVPSSQ